MDGERVQARQEEVENAAAQYEEQHPGDGEDSGSSGHIRRLLTRVRAALTPPR
jgi:hypothetical protein